MHSLKSRLIALIRETEFDSISKVKIDNSNRIVDLKSKIDSKNWFELSRLSISIKKFQNK